VRNSGIWDAIWPSTTKPRPHALAALPPSSFHPKQVTLTDSNMGSRLDPDMDSNIDSSDSRITLPEAPINSPIIEHSFPALATEFRKMQQVPTFDQGAIILAKLEQLQTSVSVLQTMQNQFQTTLN
jgi:hypothetical protein